MNGCAAHSEGFGKLRFPAMLPIQALTGGDEGFFFHDAKLHATKRDATEKIIGATI
jgi:hypothetical protein